MVMSYIGLDIHIEKRSKAQFLFLVLSYCINVFGKRLNSSLLWSILYIWTAVRKNTKDDKPPAKKDVYG
jgi:hypothetical protein